MNTLKSIIKWVLGILFLFFGLFAIEISILAAISFLISSTFLIPLTFNFINKSRKINRTLRIFIPIVGAFVGFIVIGIAGVDEVDQARKKKEKKEYEKFSPIQKDSILKTERIKDSLKIIEREEQTKLKRQKEIEIRKNNTISAYQLYNSYEANEVSADNNFKNKNFYVVGRIDNIKKDFLDNIYITLKTSEYLSSVQCYIDDPKRTSELRKGQKVTVYGKCKGLSLLNVLMEDCELVDNLN